MSSLPASIRMARELVLRRVRWWGNTRAEFDQRGLHYVPGRGQEDCKRLRLVIATMLYRLFPL
jgi:hypothetical protein